jgi:hypothetical protein
VFLSRRDFRRAVLIGAGVLLALAPAGGGAHAQAKLDARYTVTIAGIPFAKGGWMVDIGEDRFTASASGRVTGLLRAVASGEGSAASRGGWNSGRLSATNFSLQSSSKRRTQAVRMALAAGAAKHVSIEPEPEPKPDPDRVPLTDSHRRGVLDPMTASLLPIPGTGNPLVPESCDRKLSIFDGRMRYDIVLSFKRMDEVKADKGYEGPVLVCAVMYQPVAGHRREGTAIKYLMERRDMEAWLAPIAGTRVLAPFKVVIPTVIGTAVLEATEFVSVPQPQTARAAPAATGIKMR